MDTFKGKKVFGGIAIASIFYYEKDQKEVARRKVSNTKAELERFETAKGEAAKQLQALYNKALKEVGEVNAQIFDVHLMMLEDDDYNESIVNIIESQEVNAEYAVAVTGDNFAEMFANMEDEYFKARSIDVKDISERIVRILTGSWAKEDLVEPCIIAAKDLAPSETVQMDKSKLL